MKNGNEAILNKILICLYIIIIFLFVNTVALILTNTKEGSSNNTNNSSTDDSTSDYDVSMMEQAEVNTILSYFEDGSTQVVYMGRSTCGACVTFLPVLQQAQENYGYKTVYLDIETVSQSTEEFNEFIAKLDKEYTMTTSEGDVTDEFGTFYGYTPAVFIIKNGKMVDGIIGGVDQSTFESFLETNGITK